MKRCTESGSCFVCEGWRPAGGPGFAVRELPLGASRPTVSEQAAAAAAQRLTHTHMLSEAAARCVFLSVFSDRWW